MKIHVVQEGDTLWGIVQKYNVPRERILEANPDLDEDVEELRVGSQIKIPTGKVALRPRKKQGEGSRQKAVEQAKDQKETQESSAVREQRSPAEHGQQESSDWEFEYFPPPDLPPETAYLAAFYPWYPCGWRNFYPTQTWHPYPYYYPYYPRYFRPPMPPTFWIR